MASLRSRRIKRGGGGGWGRRKRIREKNGGVVGGGEKGTPAIKTPLVHFCVSLTAARF